jgi:hypothetical protein
MDNKNDKFTPEVSSPNRKNRKKRKLRGENVLGWEKLRERWADAPVSIDGVGLVSAHSTYTGSPGDISGAGKELDFNEVIPRRVRKKKRRHTVLDGEEIDTSILNPPPRPAGHTVTTFGGGIIPPMTNGGMTGDAIIGKVLPRIGRRILNNAKITGDSNPATRVDANGNGLIFDGTVREMPDPTPGNSITGAMGIVDKFKKKKPKQYAPKTNDTPFGGVENLISEQANQVEKFKTWADNKNWSEFHKQHFDWWTFPIDRGSAAYGFRYDISGQPLEDLKNNPKYLESLKNAADLYMQSMAWDLKKHDWIAGPNFDAGQDPTNNINGARLFKIARSMQLHKLNDEFNSTREMAQSLRSAGYKIGNDVFWDNPDNYHTRSSHLKNGGITGAMAGLGISPKAFRESVGGGPQRDTHKELAFIKKWADKDINNFKYFIQGKKNPSGSLTFWWKDDSTRLDYIKAHGKQEFKPGFAKFGGVPYARTGKGYAPQLAKVSKQVEQLGLIWGKSGKDHGALYDPFGIVFTHSESAENPQTAAAQQVRDFLGTFSKEINPSQYWERYNSWLNNPYVTAKNSKGQDVGVRLAFNNDEGKLISEFDRRIKQIEDDLRSSFGLSPISATTSVMKENDDYSKIPQYVVDKILETIDSKGNEKISRATTLRHLTEELRDATLLDPEQLTSAMVAKLLKDKRESFLNKKKIQNPEFLERNIIDSVTSAQARDIRDTLQIAYQIDIDEGRNPKDFDLNGFARNQFKNIDIEVIKKIHEEELKRLLDNE